MANVDPKTYSRWGRDRESETDRTERTQAKRQRLDYESNTDRRRNDEREPKQRDHHRRQDSRRDVDDRVRVSEEARSHAPRHDRDRDREREHARPPRRSASPPQSRSASHKPDFTPSGLLAAATNTVATSNGTKVVLKYNEPPDARRPSVGWRLYVFKGSEQVELLHIQRQSAYLIGRDRTVVDISVDHPSCSKQHAVIQYRYVQGTDEHGKSKGIVKPFIIDLESTNGTHVNDETIPVSRYYELKPTDVIKFGQSTREYVLLHDEAQ